MFVVDMVLGVQNVLLWIVMVFDVVVVDDGLLVLLNEVFVVGVQVVCDLFGVVDVEVVCVCFGEIIFEVKVVSMNFDVMCFFDGELC